MSAGTDKHMHADVAFEVLHRLRVAGRVSGEQLPAEEEVLAKLADDGFLRRADRGCTLTSVGLHRHAEFLASEQARIDLSELARAYERFLQVNQPVKDACALWQASGAQAGEDEAITVLDTLEGLLDRVRPSLQRAAGTVSRFRAYPKRLETALDQVAAGDHRYLTEPRIDSFHTVWFECHEDYLLTLGVEREDEESEHQAH